MTEVDCKASGKLVVMFEVSPTLTAKTFFEITSRKPDERARECVQAVVDPRRRHTKRTHVVTDHDLVLQPVREIPDVYDGRMNSSAMCRLSTFVQNGKLPSTLRVPGNDRIPPPRVKCLLKVYCRLPASTTCAPCP